MNKKLKSFFEYSLKPILLKYFLKPLNIHYQIIVPFKEDLFSKYHIFKKTKIKQKININSILTIEVSNLCNAKCIFCAYRKLNYKPQILSTELSNKTLDQFKEIGGRHVIFSPTLGENLTDSEFFDKVRYAKKLNLYVTAFSNGILLNHNNNYKKIIDENINEIVISTGDISSHFESDVFGISEDQSKQKLDGLLKLIKYKVKQNSNTLITIGFRSKRSFNKIWKDLKKTEFYELFKNEKFNIAFMLGYDNWSGNILQSDLKGVMGLKRSNNIKYFPCVRLNSVSLLPNGDIRLCSCRVKNSEHDELVIGNINTDKLDDIINSDKVKNILINYSKGKIPEVCENCTFYSPYF